MEIYFSALLRRRAGWPDFYAGICRICRIFAAINSFCCKEAEPTARALRVEYPSRTSTGDDYRKHQAKEQEQPPLGEQIDHHQLVLIIKINYGYGYKVRVRSVRFDRFFERGGSDKIRRRKICEPNS